MNRTLLFLLVFSQPAYSRGNIEDYEPGAGRGCNWSTDHGEPAPDLIGELIKYPLESNAKYAIKVIGEKPSPYLTKNRIIGQDPEACERWKTASREVKVVLSAGKSRVEAAFVKDKDNRLVRYSSKAFGLPLIQKTSCVTSKHHLAIYDLGNPVIASLYHPSACSTEGIPESDIQTLKILAEVKQIKGRTFAVSFRFFDRRTNIPITAKDKLRLEAHAVNFGFQEKSHFGNSFARSSPTNPDLYEINLFVEADKDVQPGEHWLTFGFRNFRTKEVKESSEPVKVIVGP